MSTFYAELEGGGVIAESKPFRERRRAVDPSTAARERHAELVAALAELGWTLTDERGGREWYEATLERPLERWELDEAPAAPAAAPPQPEAPTRPVEPPVRPVARLAPQEALPAPEPPPEAAPALMPAPGSGRAWKKTAGGLAGVAAAAGAAGIALAAARPSQPRTSTAQANVPSLGAAARHASPSSRRAPARPAKRPAASSVAAPDVHVTIAAPSQASWLEVRRSSAHGAVLFSGELSAGHRLRFHGARLWARFGAAGNLSISVDGKPLVLQGTYEHVFVARRRSR